MIFRNFCLNWIRWVIYFFDVCGCQDQIIVYKFIVKRFIFSLLPRQSGFESSLQPQFELLSYFAKKNPLNEIMIGSVVITVIGSGHMCAMFVQVYTLMQLTLCLEYVES